MQDISKKKELNTAAILLSSMIGWTTAVLFGVAGVFFVKFFGFSDILAAQITMGIFGFIGGLSHLLPMRTAGGKISWKQSLILSIVWALSCIGSVTFLFFASGTPLKMAVLAFYSFAFFGAFGGIANAFMMRSFFNNAHSRDVIPCVLTWSFSFGFAAIACETVGAGLQTFLPAMMAWAIAFGAMALIIGVGGGYAIVSFLMTKGDDKCALEKCGIDDKAFAKDKNISYILILTLLTLPFYLNDFSNIFISDWRLWMLIDYTTVKLFPFIVVIWLIRSKKIKLSEFGLTFGSVKSFVIVFLIGTLAGTFIVQNGYLVLNKFSGYSSLGGIPEIESSLWQWIDLTLGLLMVGVFEELIFRGFLHTFLARYTRRLPVIIGISSVAFGLIHWSGGFHQVMLAAAAGAVFMALYLRTRSLPPIMLAHFAINFIDFADVIPKSIFRFF